MSVNVAKKAPKIPLKNIEKNKSCYYGARHNAVHKKKAKTMNQDLERLKENVKMIQLRTEEQKK